MSSGALPGSGMRALPAFAGGSFGGGGGRQVIELHSHIYLDGRQITENVARHLPSVLRGATGARDM